MANRVWIELEKPRDDAHGEEIARLATNMLRRLDDADDKDNRRFWWNAHRQVYEYGNPMGFQGLPDRGNWFNLDYLGREGE